MADATTTDPNDTAPPPTTIGDLIMAEDAALAAKLAADTSVRAANDSLKAATDAEASSYAALGAGLAAVGATYRVRPDGTADFFEPSRDGTFTMLNARPPSTPLPAGSAPTAAPPAPSG